MPIEGNFEGFFNLFMNCFILLRAKQVLRELKCSLKRVPKG
jgi:hypothetical protein